MRYLFTVIAFLALTAPALAIPGQTGNQFEKWLHANAALSQVRENSKPLNCYGQPCHGVFMGEVRVGSIRVTFNATFNDDVVGEENVAFVTDHRGYDLRKHPAVLQAIFQRIYGSAIADDLKNAAQIADAPACFAKSGRDAILRGKHFIYEVFVGGPIIVFAPRSRSFSANLKSDCNGMQEP